MSEASRRADQLRAQLNDYSYHYHTLDKPLVEDAVYDSLIAELKEIETQHPELVTPDSPTQRIGNKLIGGFEKITHIRRMMSLDDVFDETEIKSWIERISKLDERVKSAEFWADLKMDGLACSLVYQDGLLNYAATRGDGQVGEDVTTNIRTIPTIPLRLRGDILFSRGRTEIRGEIVMYRTEFDRINKQLEKEGLKPYANPRNLAAGTIRQLDPAVVASRRLTFRAYDLLRDDVSEVPSQ